MLTFKDWLTYHTKRDDPVGVFARTIENDPCCRATGVGGMWSHLWKHGDPARDGRSAAWAAAEHEYDRACHTTNWRILPEPDRDATGRAIAWARLVPRKDGTFIDVAVDSCPFCGEPHGHGAGLPDRDPADRLGYRSPPCGPGFEQREPFYTLMDTGLPPGWPKWRYELAIAKRAGFLVKKRHYAQTYLSYLVYCEATAIPRVIVEVVKPAAFVQVTFPKPVDRLDFPDLGPPPGPSAGLTALGLHGEDRHFASDRILASAAGALVRAIVAIVQPFPAAHPGRHATLQGATP